MDGTAALKTARNYDGQIILAQKAADLAVNDEGEFTNANANAYVTLPAGEGMGQGVETYDWILDPETETVAVPGEVEGTTVDVTRAKPVQAGDVGEVQAPRQTISGLIWNDEDNDGLYDGPVADDPATPADETFAGEKLESGRKVVLERYTITATQQADGSFKVADDAAWTRDAAWADNWDAYDKDPTVGLTKNGVPANTQRTQTTDANGVYTFSDLPSHVYHPATTQTVTNTMHNDETGLDEEVTTEIPVPASVTIYGYRVRLIDVPFWERTIGAAKYRAGNDAQIDSDLIYANGYLMATDADGNPTEYDVLLNVVTKESPRTNHAIAPASGNAGQNTIDRNAADRYAAALAAAAEGDTVVAEMPTKVTGRNGESLAGPISDISGWTISTEKTFTYDLGLGADRRFNDAGLRTPVASKIAGVVFQDANYDGLYEPGREAVPGDDENPEGTPAVAAEPGFQNKKVILKQWFWAPANEAGEYDPTSSTYQWIQNRDFGNDFYTRAAFGATIPANQQALEDAQGQAMVFTLPTATYDAARGGVWTLTDKDGNYSFDNLPVRYTYVRTVGQLGEIADFNHAATEYLAGYTVEVLGNDEDASMSMNGLPATRLQVNGSGLESWAIDGATDPVNSKVVSAEANDATDIYAKGNYPLRWNEDTTQATATVGRRCVRLRQGHLGRPHRAGGEDRHHRGRCHQRRYHPGPVPRPGHRQGARRRICRRCRCERRLRLLRGP